MMRARCAIRVCAKCFVLAALRACVPPAASAGVHFQYDRTSITNSTLHLKRIDSQGRLVNDWTRRAGSGVVSNACEIGRGWIPDGWYNLKSPGHVNNYTGSLVQGRVWRLSDGVCHSGVMRTELFIHTEETSSNAQSCSSAFDDLFCWDGDHDFQSNGCIKLSSGSSSSGMSYIHQLWADWDGRHDFYAYDKLYVNA